MQMTDSRSLTISGEFLKNLRWLRDLANSSGKPRQMGYNFSGDSTILVYLCSFKKLLNKYEYCRIFFLCYPLLQRTQRTFKKDFLGFIFVSSWKQMHKVMWEKVMQSSQIHKYELPAFAGIFFRNWKNINKAASRVCVFCRSFNRQIV